ncbi:MAG TPA: hypothetical protein VF815_21940 [Myxococcaceae bacterium]|jgi:hypothetical protein
MRRAGEKIGLFMMLWGVGCVPGQLTINVKAAPNTNQSRPVYMVVRAVDPKAYLSQSYDEVVDKVVSPDEAVLHSSVVYPGRTRQVNVQVPQTLPVAVSFLFTSPDGAWQTLLDAMVPGTVDINLEGSRIQDGGKTLNSAPTEQAPQQEAPALGAAASASK